MIEYIETSCIGKKSEDLCEDGFFAGNGFAAVVDGSTSKASRTYHPTMSNGKLASTTIIETLKQLPSDISLKSLCEHLEIAIRNHYDTFGVDNQDVLLHPENRITASAVIYSDFHKEIWMIGDCLCKVNGKLYTNEKPHEAALAERRSQELSRLLGEGHTQRDLLENDLGRALILQGIIDSTKGQNKVFSVVDGFPIPTELVKVIKVNKGSEVILASDGYPELFDTLEETEKRLAFIIENDPLLMNLHKATKGLRPGQTSFDDRTFLRFTI